MSKATEQLAEKESYEQLTEKQRAVIDAFVENPDSNDSEIHEAANEKLSNEGESVTRAYVPVILNKYRDIAYSRREELDREKDTEEIYDAISLDQMQRGKEIEISASLSYNELMTIVESNLATPVKMKLLQSVLETIFSE